MDIVKLRLHVSVPRTALLGSPGWSVNAVPAGGIEATHVVRVGSYRRKATLYGTGVDDSFEFGCADCDVTGVKGKNVERMAARAVDALLQTFFSTPGFHCQVECKRC